MPTPSPSLRRARADYFRQLGSEPLDYDAFWLRLPVYGVVMTIVNPPAHGRALRLHDLHHVLTGYDTSLVGEAEISAWELAGGCGWYVAALGFDLAGTGLGALLAPRRSFAAWIRGRRSTNLFRRGYHPRLLDEDLDGLRAELGLASPPADPTPGDYLSFAAAATLGVAFLAIWPASLIAIALSCLAPAPGDSHLA